MYFTISIYKVSLLKILFMKKISITIHNYYLAKNVLQIYKIIKLASLIVESSQDVQIFVRRL